jgi:hypothetical protein
MTTATARADLSVVKAREQRTWASGDYAVIASLRPTWKPSAPSADTR